MPLIKRFSAGIPLALGILLSPFLLACALTAAEPHEVFVERFEGGPEERWNFDSTLDPPQLHWHTEGETPGIHFRSVATDKYVKGHDYVWAGWDVETRPLELQWEVELDRGLEQQWFLPGVAVTLTSAPPRQIDSEDLVVTMSAHMAGIAASVRRGGFYSTPSEGRGAYSRITDKVLWRPRGAGTGGAASVAWPMKHPSGATLKFEIVRDHENRLRFAVRWPDLPAGRGEPATLAEYIGPTHIKVRVPDGEAGQVEVQAQTNEHAFSGEPLFGYAPHPYLFFHAEDVPSLRKKFAKPMFRHCRRRVCT